MATIRSKKLVFWVLLIFQLLMLIAFGFLYNYNLKEDSRDASPQYWIFQDVQVMIFVGFGFLMTFLKKYAYGALGFTFLLSAVVIQWSLVCTSLIHIRSSSFTQSLTLNMLLPAEACAAIILISFGAVLGRTSPAQLIFLAFIEVILATVNEFIYYDVLKIADAGGSVVVHVFGAYFGLGVSFVLKRPARESYLEGSSYTSDITAMIGTLFLWMFWPSFNAAGVSESLKETCFVNTYLALLGSCVATFAMSIIVSRPGKFTIMHVQNATLAGGVCVGAVINMINYPVAALSIGAFSGVLSMLCFVYLQKALYSQFKVHDTCGVHNLHGLPGVFSGIWTAIFAATTKPETYGDKFFEIFPAMESSNRSAWEQAGMQLAGLTITLAISIIGGLFTGLIIKPIETVGEKFDDSLYWILEEDEDFEEPSAF